MKEKRRKLLEDKQKREEVQNKKKEELEKLEEIERRKREEELRLLKKRKKHQLVSYNHILQMQELKSLSESREKSLKSKEEKKKLDQEKFERYQQLINKRLIKNKDKLNELKQQKQRLHEFIKSEYNIKALSVFRKQLKHIFEYFAKSGLIEKQNDLGMDISKFSKFSLCFNVVPQLIQSEDLVKLFKEAIKGKGHEEIEYNDFEELLMKIGLITKNVLNDQGEIHEGNLNWEYIIEDTNEQIINNFIKYMKISATDTKIKLDKKINAYLTEDKKKPRKIIKRSLVIANSRQNKSFKIPNSKQLFDISHKDNQVKDIKQRSKHQSIEKHLENNKDDN